MVELVTISRSSQCSTICATKTVVNAIMSIEKGIIILKTNKNNNIATNMKNKPM